MRKKIPEVPYHPKVNNTIYVYKTDHLRLFPCPYRHTPLTREIEKIKQLLSQYSQNGNLGKFTNLKN